MSKSVVLVDYGVGNLLSIEWALTTVGADVIMTDDREKILNASHVVLPGVGAFGHCVDELKARGLSEVIQEYSASGGNLLGICVGMQMMVRKGEEFGEHEGLGLIEGVVKKIPARSADGALHKVPHIAWNSVRSTSEGSWRESIFSGILEGSFFYFVHSFAVTSCSKDAVLGTTDYNGHSLVAAIRSKNTYGLQFHPERSGRVGLQLLNNFLRLDK